ncbi:hypothetical protein BN1013_00789 [Candidatus Rubidus massiliensis]|nr:hypothetical protein BN1013_00789 [Candidatus Rubidus massiliensis]
MLYLKRKVRIFLCIFSFLLQFSLFANASENESGLENPCQNETCQNANCNTQENDCDCDDGEPVQPVTWVGTGSLAEVYPWGPLYEADECDIARSYGLPGVWLPEEPVLFRPFIADPRQVTYSVGWRFNDRALAKNVIDVSFGDTMAVYRFCNVWPYGGDLQFEIEGGLWAVFDPLHDESPLINADYYVGFPITYAFDRWSFRLRGYHISAHVGDEYLIEHPHFHRKNPSAEFLDFAISYELTDEIRIYDSIGVVVHQDHSFPYRHVFGQAGVEVRLRRLGGFTDYRQNLYGEPIFAVDLQTRRKKHIDQTYVLGYEIGKLNGLRRKMRIFMEYHDGYSFEGQFAYIPTKYFSIRASYGF